MTPEIAIELGVLAGCFAAWAVYTVIDNNQRKRSE